MIRTYEAGDSQLRYAVTMPREFAAVAWGRFSCRVLGRHHHITCTGQTWHDDRYGRYVRMVR